MLPVYYYRADRSCCSYLAGGITLEGPGLPATRPEHVLQFFVTDQTTDTARAWGVDFEQKVNGNVEWIQPICGRCSSSSMRETRGECYVPRRLCPCALFWDQMSYWIAWSPVRDDYGPWWFHTITWDCSRISTNPDRYCVVSTLIPMLPTS
jgi:hypothetical protein